MGKLPSGLKTFEATDTVRRAAQNENIEATDALFSDTKGHRHTGKPGDAPQIGKEGLAAGAVTTDKVAAGAILSDKIAKNTIERQHLRSGGLSSNVAKYKSVTITGGELSGVPTTPYTFQWGSKGDNHLWSIPKETALPQSITISLGKLHNQVEGMSFGSWVGSDISTLPKGFNIEVSADGKTWTQVYTFSGGMYEPFSFIPFSQAMDAIYVKLTVTAHGSSARTVLSCLSVYSRFHGGVGEDALEDIRPWGLNARMQGLSIMAEGNVTDNGSGVLTLEKEIIVMNGPAGTYFRVKAGAYIIPDWGYLYVDIPYEHAITVQPSVGQWKEGLRSYDSKDRLVLAQRNGNKTIYLNASVQSRLSGDTPQAEKVNGISLRSDKGNFQFNDGLGWRGVGIKKVQRGTGFLRRDQNIPDDTNYREIIIDPVDVSKAFINVYFHGWQARPEWGSNRQEYKETDINAAIIASNKISVFASFNFEYAFNSFSWEVIEFA
ncbi:discoidin domain-containing protein [Paenibacillus sp. J22TS3]|uniref:discoidin domain-containing protein n=1 Tax=Paenibacillus sp. J22TS3 TaxID=2807192 RepID=UPI001B26F3D4|nr:discoidin domain-containing protein [Paenibacillus sp. J22TS3]GIP24223.1 hypothetical protein J22TS3_44980 [Paenibacillus sp. J22TS3]